MGRMTGKVALITGGTSGIGAATAKLFRAEGATVIATGSSATSVEKAREQMPDIEFVISDAGEVAEVKALVEKVSAEHGRIDVLFANAGISRLASLDATDEATFDRLFNVNLRGPYFLLKYAARVMADGGSIILTSSSSAVQGMADTSVYGATKGALRSLGLNLAIELAPRRIRVNTITPGPIATSIGDKMDLTPEQVDMFGEMIGRVPAGRMGKADEIAAAALYFASDDAGFTTGADLRVDGGLTIV